MATTTTPVRITITLGSALGSELGPSDWEDEFRAALVGRPVPEEPDFGDDEEAEASYRAALEAQIATSWM